MKLYKKRKRNKTSKRQFRYTEDDNGRLHKVEITLTVSNQKVFHCDRGTSFGARSVRDGGHSSVTYCRSVSKSLELDLKNLLLVLFLF